MEAGLGEVLDDARGDGACGFGVDEAAMDFAGIGFVLGFEEGEDGAAGLEKCDGVGEDEALGGPADVDGDEVDGFGELDVEGVGAFEDDDAGVLSERPGEGAVAGIDGVDAGGCVLEEAVDESAGVGAEVCGGEAGGVDGETAECEFELVAAAGDVAGHAGASDVTGDNVAERAGSVNERKSEIRDKSEARNLRVVEDEDDYDYEHEYESECDGRCGSSLLIVGEVMVEYGQSNP